MFLKARVWDERAGCSEVEGVKRADGNDQSVTNPSEPQQPPVAATGGHVAWLACVAIAHSDTKSKQVTEIVRGVTTFSG